MTHTPCPGHAAQLCVPTVSSVTIDPLGETPVYLQLAGILRERIRSGDLAAGRPLPSYMTLMQEHGVARGTAAKAVQMLVSEGLARVVPGKGVYVVPKADRPRG